MCEVVTEPYVICMHVCISNLCMHVCIFMYLHKLLDLLKHHMCMYMVQLKSNTMSALSLLAHLPLTLTVHKVKLELSLKA